MSAEPLPPGPSRRRAPAASASIARNARRGAGRHARWAPVRDALWSLLDVHVREGAEVAVVGAGNGDDLPLARLAMRAGGVALLDVDGRAARGAVRGLPRAARRRARVVEHDVTVGAADRIVAAAVDADGDGAAEVGVGDGPLAGAALPDRSLPGGPYDLVVGDLLYSQLLYPALLDAGVARDRRRRAIDAHGAALTRAVVARLHASAPAVLHLHDLLCWGNGYEQPVGLDEILDVAAGDVDAALALAAGAHGPGEADPRAAVAALGLPVRETRLWRWPFAPGVDYLVAATLAGPAPRRGAG